MSTTCTRLVRLLSALRGLGYKYNAWVSLDTYTIFSQRFTISPSYATVNSLTTHAYTYIVHPITLASYYYALKVSNQPCKC